MRTLKLFATTLLVVLSMGISSCDKTIVEEPVTIFPNNSSNSELEKIYSKHIEDYENMTHTSFRVYGNDSVKFTGLTAKGHLMIDLFQKSSETKVFEWIGNSKIDTIYRFYKGYGEYEEVKINSIDIHYIKFYNLSKDFFTMIYLRGKELLTRALFVKGTHSKITNCFPNEMSTLILNWYNNEYCFIHDCCYTLAGDTVYTIKYGEYDHNIDNYGSKIATNGYGYFQYQFERVSAEEAVGIGIDTSNYKYQLRLARINYKTAQNIWGKQQYVKLPFEYEANAKLSYSFVNKSANIWECKVDIIYYDGTKKDYTFFFNIDNGVISENPNASPLTGKWLYTTEAGNKEIITFNGDNTGNWESVDIYDNTSNTDTFAYTVNGNEVIINYGNGSLETYCYEIVDNKMKLTYEDGHTEVYTKQ